MRFRSNLVHVQLNSVLLTRIDQPLETEEVKGHMNQIMGEVFQIRLMCSLYTKSEKYCLIVWVISTPVDWEGGSNLISSASRQTVLFS